MTSVATITCTTEIWVIVLLSLFGVAFLVQTIILIGLLTSKSRPKAEYQTT